VHASRKEYHLQTIASSYRPSSFKYFYDPLCKKAWSAKLGITKGSFSHDMIASCNSCLSYFSRCLFPDDMGWLLISVISSFNYSIEEFEVVKCFS